MLAVCLVVIAAFAAIPAIAAPTQKTYTPSASPSCIVAGASTTAFTYTLANTMPPGGQSFGSANITVPTGFSVPNTGSYTFTFANPSTEKAWTATKASNVIQLRSAAASDAIPPQGSLTLHFTVGPQTEGSYQWNTVVKQSNDFRGNNNQFSLTSGASQPITTVGTCNASPTADAVSATTDEDTATSITLTGHDAGTCELTFSIVSGPSNGDLGSISDEACTPGSPNTDMATVQYTPDADYSGSDSFTYKVNDGTSDSAAATVSITITGINDAPVAANDSYSAVEGQTLSVAAPGVLGNDADADGNTLTAVLESGPSDGTLGLSSDGSFTYDADPGFSGSDSFTYKANDGTVDSNIATVNIDVWASSLECGGSETFGVEGTQATVTNLDGEGCEPVVFTATFDGDDFDIQKPDGDQVRLRIDLDAWNPEPAINPIPATQVTPPVGGEDGVWCDGTQANFSMPDGHAWCLIEQSAQLAGTIEGVQQMQVFESWLLEGDATLCRTCK